MRNRKGQYGTIRIMTRFTGCAEVTMTSVLGSLQLLVKCLAASTTSSIGTLFRSKADGNSGKETLDALILQIEFDGV